MKEEKVKQVVHKVFGDGHDETILEYVIGILSDEDFDFGKAGDGTFESIGDMLVDYGLCEDETSARAACDKITESLSGKAAPPAPTNVRALATGPVSLSAVDQKELLYSKPNVDFMIQTPFGNLPTISEKDKLKLERRAAKEEAAARAAITALQLEAAAFQAGNKPEIIRNKGTYGAKDLHLENFSVSNGGKELVVDATVTLAFGRRYGLIGRNGTGKTTLLRALAHHEIKGTPTNCQILHVEQEVAGDDTPVIQTVLACDMERTELLQQEASILQKLNKEKGETGDAAQNGKGGVDEAAQTIELTKIYQRLQEIDADGAVARAAMILAGLSFDAPMMQRATRTFSGGWRMRIALAQALFVEPDLLLLDEPTNHLDLHAVLWLEDYLLKWPKTLLVVSHAREFLNAVCTDILHLHTCKIVTYKGNYDIFMKTMNERVLNAQKAAESQDMKRKHVQAFIDKFRFNAKRASLVQSRIKALERMAEVQVMEVDPEYVFKFPDPGAAINPPIISFTDVSFNYPGGPTLFEDLNFGIDLESRFAIVGPNGIGKSTLLGLIMGTLEPTKGVVARNPKVRMVAFSQHHVDGLDLALTPLQVMLRAYPLLKDQEARAHLGSFGIGGPLALQPLYTLSGGQKSRVAFAKLTFEKPHILLLDEPSNHLDIDAVDALVEGLNNFKGGVLMVSHDQHLIETTVDELWMCEGGRVTPFHGEFEEYKERLRSMQKK